MTVKKSLKAYLYLLPALFIAIMFSFIPFFSAFVSSFMKINQSGKVLGFAGVENYKILFSDPSFPNSISRTLLFTVIFLPLNTFLTLLAATLVRNKKRFSSVFEFIFFMPLSFSLSGASLIFKQMFRGKVSIINRIFHSDIAWLSTKSSALFTLVFLGVFLDFALDFILLFSAFRSIDKSYLEAASLDGANSFQIYTFIELPVIRPILMTVIFIALKDALLIVAPVIILTEGGPFRSTETILFYYYIEAFKSGNKAVGNTLSTLLVIGASLLTGLFIFRRHK